MGIPFEVIRSFDSSIDGRDRGTVRALRLDAAGVGVARRRGRRRELVVSFVGVQAADHVPQRRRARQHRESLDSAAACFFSIDSVVYLFV